LLELAAETLNKSLLARGYSVSHVYEYMSAQGKAWVARVRLDHPLDGKAIRPIFHDGGQFRLGEPPAPPNGKPLYRLPELLVSDADNPVVVVEGEKCVEALRALGVTATTSGGATSANVADWKPLIGKRVILWPDFDKPGASYAEEVADKLTSAGIVFDVVDVAKLGLPPKGDCVEWLEMNPSARPGDVYVLPMVVAASDDASPASAAFEKDVGPRAVLERGSDVRPVAIDWLWPGWLAAGKLHLICGAPGTGKTTIALAMAATVTAGMSWPDGVPCDSGSALIWSGEDDNADTLNPRLRVAGADMDKIFTVKAVEERGASFTFDPARDVDALRAALLELPDIRLIIIDPIVSAVSGDSHKNSEVRRGLQPLVDLAMESHCVLLGVTHFTKSTGGRDPVERVTGSLAFGASARVVLVTAVGDQGGEVAAKRTLVRAKSNLGAIGDGFEYDVEQSEVEGVPGLFASRIAWGCAVTGSARDLLNEAEASPTERSGRHAAQDWLKDFLSAGPRETNEVLTHALAAGFSEKVMRGVRERLGIKPFRTSFTGPWRWGLPGNKKELVTQDAPADEDSHTSNEGILGPAGHLGRVTCASCANFRPDEINPEGGAGDCTATDRPAYWPTKRHACATHQRAPKGTP